MNIIGFLWNCNKLQDHGDEGDEGGSQDGHWVVQVVSRYFSGFQIINLPESEPHIHTQASQPEESWKSWELKEKTHQDTTNISPEAATKLFIDEPK